MNEIAANEPVVNKNRLLVLDDDIEVAAFFGQVGESLGFEACVISDPEELFETVREFSPSVLLLDLEIPGSDGVELLRELGRLAGPKVLIASGLGSGVLTSTAELAQSMGVDIAGSFCKPIPLDELEALLTRLTLHPKNITAAQLREAVQDGQLVVHYLPKATFKGPGRWIIEGAEALVRWQHPQYGLLYPKDFISLAEQSGLIVEVTDFVFRAAMEQARVWLTHGLYMELGLNLSAQFLSDLNFADRLLSLIRESNLDPSMITLEITETAAMQDPEVVLGILSRLREMNVNLCLDDLGAGASTLAQLSTLPFSELKIENQFTNDMQLREEARAFLQGLAYLAHKLKVRVCTTGVEDERTLELVEATHCDKAQGHLFGAAVRAHEFEAVVERWNCRFAVKARLKAAS